MFRRLFEVRAAARIAEALQQFAAAADCACLNAVSHPAQRVVLGLLFKLFGPESPPCVSALLLRGQGLPKHAPQAAEEVTACRENQHVLRRAGQARVHVTPATMPRRGSSGSLSRDRSPPEGLHRRSLNWLC
jgi:hypothetical protein